MFISFEGTNACGKSTILEEVYKKIESEKLKVFKLKLPSQNELGTLMRTLTYTLSPTAMACLSVADKYQCIDTEVKQKLKEDYIVFSERTHLSAYLYNAMDDIDFEYTKMLLSRMLVPDVTIVFKADKQIIVDNLKQRNWLDRYETRIDLELELLDKAIEYFKSLGHPLEIIEIDKNLQNNVDKVLNVLKKYI